MCLKNIMLTNNGQHIKLKRNVTFNILNMVSVRNTHLLSNISATAIERRSKACEDDTSYEKRFV